MEKSRREKAKKDIAKLQESNNDAKIVVALLTAREKLKVSTLSLYKINTPDVNHVAMSRLQMPFGPQLRMLSAAIPSNLAKSSTPAILSSRRGQATTTTASIFLSTPSAPSGRTMSIQMKISPPPMRQY